MRLLFNAVISRAERLRRLINLSGPLTISRFANEVLLHIFSFAVWIDFDAPFNLMLVSSKWEMLMTSTPWLWANILAGDALQSDEAMYRLQCSFGLSGDCSVDIMVQGALPDEQKALILAQKRRVNSVIFSGGDYLFKSNFFVLSAEHKPMMPLRIRDFDVDFDSRGQWRLPPALKLTVALDDCVSMDGDEWKFDEFTSLEAALLYMSPDAAHCSVYVRLQGEEADMPLVALRVTTKFVRSSSKVSLVSYPKGHLSRLISDEQLEEKLSFPTTVAKLKALSLGVTAYPKKDMETAFARFTSRIGPQSERLRILKIHTDKFPGCLPLIISVLEITPKLEVLELKVRAPREVMSTLVKPLGTLHSLKSLTLTYYHHGDVRGGANNVTETLAPAVDNPITLLALDELVMNAADVETVLPLFMGLRAPNLTHLNLTLVNDDPLEGAPLSHLESFLDASRDLRSLYFPCLRPDLLRNCADLRVLKTTLDSLVRCHSVRLRFLEKVTVFNSLDDYMDIVARITPENAPTLLWLEAVENFTIEKGTWSVRRDYLWPFLQQFKSVTTMGFAMAHQVDELCLTLLKYEDICPNLRHIESQELPKSWSLLLRLIVSRNLGGPMRPPGPVAQIKSVTLPYILAKKVEKPLRDALWGYFPDEITRKPMRYVPVRLPTCSPG